MLLEACADENDIVPLPCFGRSGTRGDDGGRRRLVLPGMPSVLMVLLMLMELVLVLFCTRGDVGILVGEHSNKAGRDLVVFPVMSIPNFC
jgi:hypothetical protein